MMTESEGKNGMLAHAVAHVASQLFVAATGAAALVHSTWSLGTLLSGLKPEVVASISDASSGFINGAWIAQSLALLGWLLPAFAIAFAIDVGQIVTSHQIRTGAKSFFKYLTFIVFALATYYLQWLYAIHHAALVETGAGVSQMHIPAVEYWRDNAIFLIPALLPLATLLYTFGQDKKKGEGNAQTNMHKQPAMVEVNVHQSNQTAVIPSNLASNAHESTVHNLHNAPKVMTARANAPRNNGKHTGEIANVIAHATKDDRNFLVVTCPHCGVWHSSYKNEASAASAMKAHFRGCKARAVMQNANANA